MSFWVVIPARYASTRLPGKLLLEVAGKPILQHVYERAVQSGAERVVIATDDDKIVDMANAINADVVMTSEDHPSGTDRIAEVMRVLKVENDTIVVNVQGDEPLIEPGIIKQVAELLQFDDQCSITTLATPINNSEELFNPNIVKVVFDHQGTALYFSRASIPWNREQFSRSVSNLESIDFNDEDIKYYRHIGIYAYRAQFLETYINLQSSALDKAESLEQLKAMYHGYKIRVAVTKEEAGIGVDTEEDYQKVKSLLENN